jgi:hypothetical protein
MQTLTKVSDKLTLVSTEVEDDIRNTYYSCDVRVTLAGDSIWDCELTDADDVRIIKIYVNEGIEEASDTTDGNIGYRHIGVYYTVNGFDDMEALEGSWTVYTDTGFANTVSELLGEEIYFTEQGMQEDGYASME